MKLIILRLWIIGAIFPVFLLTARSAAPSNDNFANRTVLSGADIDFTGTVFGASFEANEPTSGILTLYPDWGSVWWSWTLAIDGFVAITASQVEPGVPDVYPFFVAYKGSAFTTLTPASGRNGDRFELSPGYFIGAGKSYGGFPVSAGQTYSFQLAASFGTNLTYAFHLKLSERPIVVGEPQDQIVASGGAAVFRVIAPNITRTSVQ